MSSTSTSLVKAMMSRFEVLQEQSSCLDPPPPPRRLDDFTSSSGPSPRRCLKENDRPWRSECDEDDSNNKKSLSRQNSDPVKRLHRTPAFRCDRSEKIRERPEDQRNPESSPVLEATRARLKKLGSTIQERLIQDDLAFARSEVPRHVLDMYAKVLKPKNRNDGAKSDSGVSSENENPQRDEDDELSVFMKNKNVDEGVASVETLKKIMREPLPPGPPPKKPPRTFAAVVPPPLPTTEPPIKRSREESRKMLDKIESALMKHQSSGKIVTPTNFNGSSQSAATTLKISEKPEVHYMCTELLGLDLNSNRYPNLNESSEGSVASEEDSSRSLSECLGSLNCTGARKYSAIPYKKFGTNPPPTTMEACCSCNKQDSNNSSNTSLALSTFAPITSSPNQKCDMCGLNASRQDRHFKCHLECTCRDEETAKTTKFFVTTTTPPGHYGSLNKPKEQKEEHIYDEPEKAKEKTPFVRNDFKSKTLGPQTNGEELKRRLQAEMRDHQLAPLRSSLESPKTTRSKPPPSDRAPIVRAIRRPHFLELGHPQDIDKRKLNSLISEIYDTVNVACQLESPHEDQSFHNSNGIERDFHNEYKNYEDICTNPMANRNLEMAEATLKLTRSLTEKRKAYIRRVSSRRGDFPAPSNPRGARMIKQNSMHEGRPYGTFTTKSNFQKIKSLFEEPPPLSSALDNKKKIEIPREEPHSARSTSVPNRLFEICALIGWNFNTCQAYIKSVFPENATLPPQIESLVFPESCNVESTTQSFTRNTSVYRKARCETLAEDSQLYSLILTNEDGRRSYGYCRRVVPEGAPFCLPLAYCIISNYKAPALYYKILQEIESHHGSSDVISKSILNQLYNENFPKPGCAIFLKNWRIDKDDSPSADLKKNSVYRSSLNLGDFSAKSSEGLDILSDKFSNQKFDQNVSQRRKSTDLSQKFPNILSGQNGATMIKSLEKIYSGEQNKTDKENKKLSPNQNNSHICYFNRESKTSVLNRSFILNANKLSTNSINIDETPSSSDMITIKRSSEPRIEEDSLYTLFDLINVDVLAKIFGSLLLERKVIIVGDKLSKLSAAIEGLQSVLYPFIWQHTLISTIPTDLRKIIFEAPIPILAGVFCPIDNDQMHLGSIKKNPKNNREMGKVSTLPNTNGKKHRDLKEELDLSEFEDGMVIDISSYTHKTKSLIVQMQGDESTILPPSLGKILRAGLQLGSHISLSNSQSKLCAQKSANILVAEAFLRFFTTFLEDYQSYLVENSSIDSNNDPADLNINILFDKENYIKSFTSKHVQLFLEWFIETSMFKNFIKDQKEIRLSSENRIIVAGNLPHPDFYDIFNERIVQIKSAKKEKENLNVTKSNYKTVMNKKMKVWRDKLKDLIN